MRKEKKKSPLMYKDLQRLEVAGEKRGMEGSLEEKEFKPPDAILIAVSLENIKPLLGSH